MTTDEFRTFVGTRLPWFKGRVSESAASIDAAEASLGVKLPASMAWLLQVHGYWHGTGVSNLGESVARTLRVRASLGLDRRYVLLEDLGDAGCVLIDTMDEHSPAEGSVIWADSHAVRADPDWQGAERFASFGDYVASHLDTIMDEIDPADVACDGLEDEPEHSGG